MYPQKVTRKKLIRIEVEIWIRIRIKVEIWIRIHIEVEIRIRIRIKVEILIEGLNVMLFFEKKVSYVFKNRIFLFFVFPSLGLYRYLSSAKA